MVIKTNEKYLILFFSLIYSFIMFSTDLLVASIFIIEYKKKILFKNLARQDSLLAFAYVVKYFASIVLLLKLITIFPDKLIKQRNKLQTNQHTI